MEKINVAQLLKDCPKGMELYSPIFGTVYFEGIRDTGRAILIDVTTSCNTSVQFYSDGKFNTYYSESEVTLFPSKNQRDWSKFQRPFKNGDVIFTQTGDYAWVSIFKQFSGNNCCTHIDLCINDNDLIIDARCLCDIGEISTQRLATEEEKQKLFQAIKDNGYRWNPKTKSLEKMVKDKFDINTLVPFESKVLIRNDKEQHWIPAFWGCKCNDDEYVTTYGWSLYCIPYEGNEHLCGTTDDCDYYYKTWE